ncbi:hypothetical protein ACFSHR_04490 [Azotobacter chroococcum]
MAHLEVRTARVIDHIEQPQVRMLGRRDLDVAVGETDVGNLREEDQLAPLDLRGRQGVLVELLLDRLVDLGEARLVALGDAVLEAVGAGEGVGRQLQGQRLGNGLGQLYGVNPVRTALWGLLMVFPP